MRATGLAVVKSLAHIATNATARCLKVIGYDFREYLLKHDREANQWFLLQEWAGLAD
jgi:hypothetical protein